jgi:hypothetical protein
MASNAFLRMVVQRMKEWGHALWWCWDEGPPDMTDGEFKKLWYDLREVLSTGEPKVNLSGDNGGSGGDFVREAAWLASACLKYETPRLWGCGVEHRIRSDSCFLPAPPFSRRRQ